MGATFLEARPSDSAWIGWLKRELAPTRPREIRTAIIVAGVGANSRLNHSREPNGSIAGSTGLALIALI